MWIGSALIAGSILYLHRLLTNYENYGDTLRNKRCAALKLDTEAKLKWNVPPPKEEEDELTAAV